MEKTSAVTKQEMSLKSVLVDYLGFVSTPRPMIQINGWKLHKIPCTKQCTHCFRKYFHPLPLQLQWRKYLASMGFAREAERGI